MAKKRKKPAKASGPAVSPANTQGKAEPTNQEPGRGVGLTRNLNEGGEENGAVSSSSPSPEAPAAPMRDETWAQASNRWIREGCRGEADTYRETVRNECTAKGISRLDAKGHSWKAAIAAFPPSGKPAVTVAAPESTSSAPGSTMGGVQGLGDIPVAWGVLPLNASQQAELGWVQAHRLAVVEELPSGGTRVDLAHARAPAPSMAALGWLETSIRAYSKYVDVVARSLRDEDDEKDHVRRERMALEEIRELLQEMRDVVVG